MLYFSKLKISIIYFIIISLSFFSFLNFSKNEDNFFLSKNVNLGLDLQGGSYLLLEVDSQPVVKLKLQSKLVSLRKILKEHSDVKLVAAIHAETSTGVLNPIKELSAVAHENNALFMADCVTSLGGSELRFDDWDID